ncbi:hypothetical protein RRG08_066159 [Elysia crispata]|uniref:Uncharacterized protein n=1 Tax=Elysia crispata TaxID=231223 RepID=A0AAE0Y2I6_9GAST|nr:hypothetical protein RRG08_066159 [Elysia crispata]
MWSVKSLNSLAWPSSAAYSNRQSLRHFSSIVPHTAGWPPRTCHNQTTLGSEAFLSVSQARIQQHTDFKLLRLRAKVKSENF